MKVNFHSNLKSGSQSAIAHDLLQEKPYSAITNNIEVCVWPEFVDRKVSAIGDLFIWAYHVRIANKSVDKINIISRYWRIIDECGNVQEIEGEGVVGEKPVIAPNASYQYSSGVHLKYPSGIMLGRYRVKNLSNGESYEIKIPSFSLDIPSANRVLN